MRTLIFILLSALSPALVIGQNMVRLDNSQITVNQLDNKINQLMKDASVAGMTITRDPLQTNTNIYACFQKKSLE